MSRKFQSGFNNVNQLIFFGFSFRFYFFGVAHFLIQFLPKWVLNEEKKKMSQQTTKCSYFFVCPK
eukprot:m.179973 g.179973  ORF g.179973 m.179973 type:complete len:65 (-) comp31997_c1_seq2:243-437(-)